MFLLSGCSSLNTNVTAYDRAPPKFNHKTYAYLPAPKTGQKTSPAFEFYTRQFDKYFAKLGMEKTLPSKANYRIVLLYYTGKPMEQTSYMPLYGQTGTRIVNSDTYGNFSDNSLSYQTTYNSKPTYGVTGYMPTEEYYFPYYLTLDVFRASKGPYFGNGRLLRKPIYQASTVAVSQDGRTNVVFPLMIKAIFINFPGQDGITQNIKVPIKN